MNLAPFSIGAGAPHFRKSLHSRLLMDMEVDQFCRDVELSFFSWDSFLPLEERCRALLSKLEDAERESLQRDLVRRLLQCDLSAKFPVHPESGKRFLKRLILSLEASGVEVDEALYHAMAQSGGVDGGQGVASHHLRELPCVTEL